MDPFLTLCLGLMGGAALGFVAAIFRGRQKIGAELLARSSMLEARHTAENAQFRSEEAVARANLSAELAGAQAALTALREQLVTQREQYSELVNCARSEAAERVAREQTQSKVLEALAPVRSSLQEMHHKVSELETQRTLQHGELSQQLRNAGESEERLRTTAESLASALRSNNTRGVWGETQLRTVVEAAGLIERVDFDVQSHITSDAGVGRPDMVVHLPGGKNIAVDAKVPFAAYLEASNIPATATGVEAAQRDVLMKQHVKAVRDHIVTLGGKSYWEGLDASPEFVVAFIPSESLVSSALHADPSILEFAFTKRVALASPVTLWSILKTVAFTWQQDVVTQEAKALFDLSTKLYGRLSTMAGHIDKLGRSVKATVNDYNKFVGSLERQVLPSARKLTVLDESRFIPEPESVEETPREITAPELVTELEHKHDHEKDKDHEKDLAVTHEASGLAIPTTTSPQGDPLQLDESYPNDSAKQCSPC